jgi:phosphosulfolactate synthase (CoM biosynthesis protein A)
VAQLVEELKQLVALESLIETAGEYIDFLKLGWGTADVSTGVKAKVVPCVRKRVSTSASAGHYSR